eukprot:g45851.t1
MRRRRGRKKKKEEEEEKKKKKKKKKAAPRSPHQGLESACWSGCPSGQGCAACAGRLHTKPVLLGHGAVFSLPAAHPYMLSSLILVLPNAPEGLRCVLFELPNSTQGLRCAV